EVVLAISALDVRPVLTAHPTESTRRTLLSLQARVADLLLSREGAPNASQKLMDAALDTEIEILWLTAEVRQDRPTVGDEVSTVLWYLETRLLDASADAGSALVRAFEEEFPESPRDFENLTPLRLGTWVGGDRDGNPFVTPEATLAASRRASFLILGHYDRIVSELIRRLSISESIAPASTALRESLQEDRVLLPDVWDANSRRNADEPLRLKLTFMSARLQASRDAVAARDAGKDADSQQAYSDAADFERDLGLVRDTLMAAKADHARRLLLEPLIAAVRAHGFHGLMMDVRDHAASHRDAVAEIAKVIGAETMDSDQIKRELLGRRPLVSDDVSLSDDTRRVLDTFRIIRTAQTEMGEAAMSTYIVSMTRDTDDLLRVLLLAREAGLLDLASEHASSSIDIVPLFETLGDLENAPAVMRSLFESDIYMRQLAARGMRQEVMIGYSDSAKDAGILASSWALYRTQELLAPVFAEAGVTLLIFHGRGGSVGRGGGSPVYRALSALPPDSVNRRIKITEQGEIISQQFGLLPLAERTMEVTLSGVLLHGFSNWRDDVDEAEIELFRKTMERIGGRSALVYRSVAHDDPELFRLFEVATPIEELASVRFGSRPAYRPGAAKGVDGIRAIPWVFGWTQNRLMLPGWLGVGTALEEVVNESGGLELLQRMAGTWPFFDDLLAKIAMVCAKADMQVAHAYVSHLGGDVALLARLIEEYERTVALVKKIRGSERLLDDNEVVQAAITLRNPYVDALSLLQISLLSKKRGLIEGETEQREIIEDALATTVSGIAQGLRNTG
ncbi:MAG TPA: phosphoenolpyruvate carboxylase, partial [Gemmatimonadaceae bacterium]|nr:phosphoenolpyruvate carboxylase [Gemmatimonadaceae bacterium]